MTLRTRLSRTDRHPCIDDSQLALENPGRSVYGTARLFLKAFGTVKVTNQEGTVVLPLVTQPLRCAVLAFLTIESANGFQSRDKLVAMFWPDSDDARSRRSLNQLLYSLRQQLGSDVIDRRGEDQLGVNRDLIECDALEFLDCVQRGDFQRCLELYDGELLDGLFPSRSPDFERWLDARRAEFRTLASKAAWHLSDAARSEGDTAEAGRLARVAADLTPYDEGAMQRLLQLLDELGQRTTAMQVFRTFETRMRRELEIDPSPETRLLLASIRERAALHESPAPPSPRLPNSSAETLSEAASTIDNSRALPVSDSETVRARNRLTHRWMAVIGAGMLLVVVALSTLLRNTEEGATTSTLTTNPRRIAVLFFDDLSPTQTLGWLARGLTVDLIHDLSALDTLHVVPAAGVQPFRNQTVPLDSIARALQVGTLVNGSIRVADDRLEVTVELIDATAGYRVETRRFSQPAREVFQLQSEILFGINRFLREHIGRSAELVQRRREMRNVNAWRMVQQGEELLESGIARGRFGASALAWATLAVADSLFENASRMEPEWVTPILLRARVARAQYLSLTLVDLVPGQAPGSAGMIALALGRIEAGQEHVRRALSLAPGHAEASTLEGYFLYSRWFVNGQPLPSTDLDSAEAKLRRVVERNSDQALAWLILSRALRFRGSTTQADLAAQRAFAADPFLWEGRRAIVSMIDQYVERGQQAEARQLCESTRHTYVDDRDLVECRLMLLGWFAGHRDSIAAAWRELRAIEASGAPGFATSWTTRRMYVAAVAARAGLADSASAIIARAYAARGKNRADSTKAALAEAWILALSQRRTAALQILDSLVGASGDQRHRIATHPWFESLRTDTAFARITAERETNRPRLP